MSLRQKISSGVIWETNCQTHQICGFGTRRLWRRNGKLLLKLFMVQMFAGSSCHRASEAPLEAPMQVVISYQHIISNLKKQDNYPEVPSFMWTLIWAWAWRVHHLIQIAVSRNRRPAHIRPISVFPGYIATPAVCERACWQKTTHYLAPLSTAW